MDDRDRWAQFFTAIMTARAKKNSLDELLDRNDPDLIPMAAKVADIMMEEYHKRFVKDTNSPYRTK